MIDQERLISHEIHPENIKSTMLAVTQRLKQQNAPNLAIQLTILDQLSQFDFGRYLLINKGINGYWTHYMLMHPMNGRTTGLNNRGEKFTKIESFLLDRAPTMLATQERFKIFLEQNQQAVQNQKALASIPSGMMGELLYLDYDAIADIQLIGIDYDVQALADAKVLAQQRNLSGHVTIEQKDAWNLNIANQFDLISSNGLNIYEDDDERVIELYQGFCQALKRGGKLVTSFLTPPPTGNDQSEWNMSKIDHEDLLLQKLIFVDIIGAKWQCYRSSQQTKTQLEAAGFENIMFFSDNANMFPTVTAQKR